MPRRVGYALLACVLAAAAIEGGAALLERVLPHGRTLPTPSPDDADIAFSNRLKAAQTALREDETLGWGLPASALTRDGDLVVRTNTLGLRGPEIAPKAPGETRLLTLGDSSIYGHGVAEKDVFSSVAARRLAERRGAPVSAVIGGVPGYDSTQALAQLARVGGAVDPDWVVIGCLWSDLYRQDGAPSSSGAAARARSPLRRLATYRVLRRALAPWLQPDKVRWVETAADLGAAGHTRTPLDRYLANLGALARDARDLGARPLFLLLPAPMDLDAVPAPETVRLFRAAMAVAAERAGAPLVDGPALLRGRGGELGWFLDNVHPSAAGHAALGEAVADAIAGE